ncbi:interferon-induced, double-stranded RNA-activated protein kinase-like [Epinephelus moara]|uniref:interferon-induced, double-stranded RNA-activated protein kinase-like n=1 Tax=Epinephelus moara TaxID=300413 RepID=UPI00214EB221|nr:interferon-induced, double-stranded RNA-activated protein kinase-like [Epinephelus moara]
MDVAKLNEYAQKERLEPPKYEDVGCVGPAHMKTFTIRAVLGGKAYPDGVGKSKKEAKQNAAKNALRVLFGKPDDSPGEEKQSGASSQPEEELDPKVSDICDKIRSVSVRTKDEGLTKTNFIAIVNSYCQKKDKHPDYILVEKHGPPHNPQFFYKLRIDNKDYPMGEGKTAKEAKQNAAGFAWSALQEQTDWDSKVSVRSTVSEDGEPSMLSVPSATPESHESSTQSTPVITFKDSTLSKAQDAVKDKNMGNGPKETSTQSRFTSDFDPMECLGRGAFGRVYKARHKLLDKFYAVKIVCCDKKSLREVGTLSDLHHRNIIRYYTFWMEDSGYKGDNDISHQSTENSSAKYLYIQMELCVTKTLRGWIDEKNTQPLQDSKRREESLRIAQQIVSGVEYIHSEKHIHRDLKPANILFGLNGEIKIGDFGLVTRDDDGSFMDRTENKGTPIYRAPEQWRERNYDRKVDIFPLGLIYFELLWKLPTGQETRNTVLIDARNQKLPDDFSLTFPEENQLIKLMLHVKPEDRPEASKLRAELEKWAQTFNSQNVSEESYSSLLMEENKNYIAELHKFARGTGCELKYEDMVSCSALFDNGAPAKPSTPPTTLESSDLQSKRVASTSCDSVVFTNSSSPPMDQDQNPVVKPKSRKLIRLQDACESSKEDVIIPRKRNTGNSPSENISAQISRFTSEFDSIVCLGRGAFGCVFKAKHKLTGKDYAVKIVLCKEKALREVMALSDLSHRNIVRYFSSWLEDSRYQWNSADDSCSTSQSSIDDSSVKCLYIQMELCSTKTLRVWIDEKNILNVKKSLRDSKRRDESLSIAQKIASAVEYIHSKMLIHRDLKPANIMFGQDGEVKIGDFGLATNENDDIAENLIERTCYKGTPSYMAPEQKSQKNYDRKVDIFALGLIFFELLWNIPTAHERHVVWKNVRTQKFPVEFQRKFHQEYIIIKPTLCEKPGKRPEASKLKTDLEQCSRTLNTQELVRRGSRTV